MDYHSEPLTIEAEQLREETILTLQAVGPWVQQDADSLAEHVVELEQFAYLPTIHNAQMVDSLCHGALTLSLVSWRTRWQHISKYQPHEYNSHSIHALLHIRPTADAGHLMLRPETLADKVNEFFRRVEIDFPGDRVFSRKHYVLAKDASTAESLLTEEVRQCLNAIPHAAMESRYGRTVLAPLAVATPGLVGPLLRAGHALAKSA